MSNKVQTPKRQRNLAIEVWRVIVAVAVVGYHLGWILPLTFGLSQGTNGYWLAPSNWAKGGGEVLFIFTFTSGYFLAKQFNRKKLDPAFCERSAFSRAAEYLWNRVKALGPVLAIGIILGLISMSMFDGTDAWTTVKGAVNGLWEFCGLYIAGFSPSYGAQQPNAVLWFISALFICSYFIYWAICKNEDVFTGFAAPFIFVFLGGWWCHTDTRPAQTSWSTLGAQILGMNSGNGTNGQAMIGFNNGFLFVLVGMCGGVMLYYLIEKLETLNFSKGTEIGLTVLNVVASSLLLWYIFYPTTIFDFNRWTVYLLCIIVISLSLLNKDYLTHMLNAHWMQGVVSYLGGCALYIYMTHVPIFQFIIMIMGKNTQETMYTWAQVFWPTLIVSTIVSAGLKFVLDKYVIKKG